MLSIQDIGPAPVVGVDVCVCADPGVDVLLEVVVLESGGGTNVGLGDSTSDMRISDEVGFGFQAGGGASALDRSSGSSVMRARERRLCIRELRLPAREREGAVTTSPSEACTLSWAEDMELAEKC